MTTVLQILCHTFCQKSSETAYCTKIRRKSCANSRISALKTEKSAEYLTLITINGTEYSMTDETGTYGAQYVPQDETDKTIGYDRVDIESNVDTDVSGYYEVTFSFEDTEKNTGTGHARLYVVVLERGMKGK